MGSTYDVKIENKNRKNLNDLELSLKNGGFKHVEMRYNKRLFVENLLDIIYLEEESMFLLSGEFSSLIEYIDGLPKLKEDVIKKWVEITAFVMKIVGANHALNITDALQFCKNLDFDVNKLCGIYYKELEELFPLIKKSIQISSGKNIGDDEVNKLIEESTNINYRVGDINYNTFLFVDPSQKLLKNKLEETIKKEGK